MIKALRKECLIFSKIKIIQPKNVNLGYFFKKNYKFYIFKIDLIITKQKEDFYFRCTS